MPDRILVINPNSTDAVTRATTASGGGSGWGLGESNALLHGTSARLTALERLVDRGVSVEAFALAAAGSRLNDRIRGTDVRAEQEAGWVELVVPAASHPIRRCTLAALLQ